jgi:hypothetical protein
MWWLKDQTVNLQQTACLTSANLYQGIRTHVCASEREPDHKLKLNSLYKKDTVKLGTSAYASEARVLPEGLS